MDDIPLLDRDTTRALLEPCKRTFVRPEEDMHRWSASPSLHFEDSSMYRELRATPLLRVWDAFSGSTPDPSSGNRMLARSERGILATQDARKTTLAIHADHAIWEDMPYISFTTSPDAISSIANYRQPRRGDQHLVAVDLRHRLRRGLPILNMKREMEAYGVRNPYGYDYFTDHYLCLWEVTPEETIGAWHWDDSLEDANW